ncbi:stonustoxin subunit beta-like [Micropterus dolomieu]|uniref:stonustoxin subunit beta-like n=1 Tax=Micropterus dolomieu TaxID=147949 RepID=UPI001E8D012B|nr:stonustoxin subunit beta-like [Micropterus dolomieu]
MTDTNEVAALGRPFTLGMLYNAQKDQLITGLTLWDDKTLKENTVEISQHSSAFEISTSDSIGSKSSLLDVDASLKVSYMCGLITVGGSAKYLNDKKKFKNQSRVTCQYKATTHFKELKMIDHLTMKTKQTDVIRKGSATHVVTGILYGANAFFVFDSEKLDASSVQNIQGKMEAVIKKIPSFNIEGKVDIKLNDEEKALTEKFSCKFYGDFILESNPTTFVDAVKTYIQLPKLLGEKGENGVPLKVWLMPLKKLYSRAPELMREISVGLVRKAEDALEDLNHLEKGCNDLLEDTVVKDLPQINEKLSCFQKLCHYYASDLRQTMEKKIPFIRKGKEDESELEKVFEDRDKSPFSHEKLTKWMDHKEREINIIRSCVEKMEGTKIIRNKSELDREVLSVEDALCFVFTSLESTNEEPWYYSDKVFAKMREKARFFRNIEKTLKNNSRFRFLIAAIANKKYTGATIYHYREGKLVTDDFFTLPPVEKITDRRDLIWYSCDLTLDPDTANGYLTLSEGNKKAAYGAWQWYPDLPQRFDTYVCQVLCREGLTGRCYWEVEWSTGSVQGVAVGVTYKGLFRKGNYGQCGLGRNIMSWSLDHTGSPPGDTLCAWHNSQSQYLPGPATRCSRLGVYLDWPAGTLSYYNVSADTLSHLHTFHNKFSEPVYPGFGTWYYPNYVFLCL